MKENSDGNDTNVGSIGNSIEEAIERLEYIDRAYSYNNYYSVWDLKCIEILLSDYKRVLKENERYKKSDYETICLENNELREITDRIQSEYNDLLKDNFKLKNELETKRKEYQETYKDVREELKELRKENEELKEERQIVGIPVRNKRDRRIGIVLHQWESGSVAVLESINPRVINTHDSWNTLEIVTDEVKQTPPPEPQLPTKTICESFSKKVRNNNEII